MKEHPEVLLFGGSASTRLATKIAHLMGQPLARSFIERFADGEINVRVDEAVRGREIFIVQSTGPPAVENLFELLAFADACRRSAARSVTAVVPYFGYARSDKRHGRREPIMASMVAELMQTVGISHVLTLDLHAPQIEGFFRIPVDSLTAVPTLVAMARLELPDEFVVVSPDAGRVKTATEFARRLRRPVVVLHKQRANGSVPTIVNVVGDVKGLAVLIIDDMISTGNTIAESVNALLRAGARAEVYIAATHGVFVNGVGERLAHPAIRRIFVTDSVENHRPDWPCLSTASLAPLLAAAIRRLHDNESLSSLYTQPIGPPPEPRHGTADGNGETEHVPTLP